MKTDIIVEVVNACFEAVITIFYLYGVMKESYRFRKVILFFAGLVLAVTHIAVIVLELMPLIGLAVTFIFILLIAFVLFECKLSRKIFCSVVFLVIIFGSEIIPWTILYVFNFATPEEMLSFGIGRLVGMVGSKIICFWLTVYITVNLKVKLKEIPLKNWIAIVITPILSIVILGCIFVSADANKEYAVKYTVAVASLVLLNLFVFDFFDTYARQLKLALMEKQLEFEKENYKLIEIKYNEIRQLKHDIKNQIEAATNLVHRGKKQNALQYLSELSEELSNAGDICYTGISAIDSVINIKRQEAVSKNIKYLSKVTVQKEFEIDLLDLCRILSNALENAVEACENFDGDEKFIYITFHAEDNKLQISIMNSSNKVDTNNLKTTKSGGGLHGIGIGSIQNSVQRLGGIVAFNWNDGVFSVDLFFNY